MSGVVHTRGKGPQDGLGNVQICGMILASVSRSLMVDFIFFLFSLYFIFLLLFLFFSIFRTTWVRVLSVMLSHQSQVDGIVTRLIMGLERIE